MASLLLVGREAPSLPTDTPTDRPKKYREYGIVILIINQENKEKTFYSTCIQSTLWKKMIFRSNYETYLLQLVFLSHFQRRTFYQLNRSAFQLLLAALCHNRLCWWDGTRESLGFQREPSEKEDDENNLARQRAIPNGRREKTEGNCKIDLLLSCRLGRERKPFFLFF